MFPTSRPRVLIADDHALIAEAFRKLLAVDFDVVEIVHDGRRLIETARDLRPDVVLVDIGMPLLNGLQAARRIKRILPRAKLVFVTINQDRELVDEAFRQGADAYLPKTVAASELLLAIHQALKGEQYMSPLLGQPNEPPYAKSEPLTDTSAKLTERQLEVLRTVAFHKYRLMQTLQLKNDAEVVQYAVRRGIVFE
jgi:DNA-binding NarL/FixJ family response regulator